jgi:hypothetical protein
MPAIGTDGVRVSSDNRIERCPESALALGVGEPMPPGIVPPPEVATVCLRFASGHSFYAFFVQ